MSTKKLKIDQLEVKSFVTEINVNNVETLKGGTMVPQPVQRSFLNQPNFCNDELPCPSNNVYSQYAMETCGGDNL